MQPAIILIAAAIIVVVGLIVLVINLIPDKKAEEPNTAYVTGISVQTLPKTEYHVGDEFDKSGMVVSVKMSDGTNYLVNSSDSELSFSGFDSSKVNDSVEVLVTYKGFKASFNVSISRAPVVVEGTVTGISIISTSTRNYYVGEELDAEGIIIEVTVEEREQPYRICGVDPDVVISGFDSSAPAELVTITVAFRDFTTTYDITVREKPENIEDIITRLNIASYPQLSYYVGQNFNPEGLRIQVITNEQATTFFVNYDDPELIISGFDSSKAVENQEITVSYKGFKTSFNVTIKDFSTQPTIVSIEVFDLIDTYTVEKWNTNGLNLYGAYIKCTYSDGSVVGSYEETPLLWEHVSKRHKVDGPETIDLTITYKGVSTTVTITITE